MPPRVKTSKVTKTFKNSALAHENKASLKNNAKSVKTTRKPLADKTNSASDDNASNKELENTKYTAKADNFESVTRPRRARRVPSRFADENGLCLKSDEKSPGTEHNAATTRPRRDSHSLPLRLVRNNVSDLPNDGTSVIEFNPKQGDTVSPFEMPSIVGSIVGRPRRVQRLPSKFDDNFVSPRKLVPIQPWNASTPKELRKDGQRLSKKDISVTKKAMETHPSTSKKEIMDSGKKIIQTAHAVMKGKDSRDTIEKDSVDMLQKNIEENNQKKQRRSASRGKTDKMTEIETTVTVKNNNIDKEKVPRRTTRREKTDNRTEAETTITLKNINFDKERVPRKITRRGEKDMVTEIETAVTLKSNNINKEKVLKRNTRREETSNKIETEAILKNINFDKLRVLRRTTRRENTDRVTETDTTVTLKNNNLKKEMPRNLAKGESDNPKSKTEVTPNTRRNNFSYRILEKNKSPEDNTQKLAVYEFTFDPNEEPPPQKKKKKKVVRKKAPPKPKTFVVKNNYDSNLSKTLNSLKKIVAKKNGASGELKSNVINDIVTADNLPAAETIDKASNSPVNVDKEHHVHFESFDEPDINYSPSATPAHPAPFKMSAVNDTRDQLRMTVQRSTPRFSKHNENYLNKQDDFSFFDDQPVASSSLNMSKRDPNASPWRVDFDCIRPMKHVYTNIGIDNSHTIPDIVTEKPEDTRWKQTSIIDFIREVAEKKAKKKKSLITPTKVNSIFNDTNMNVSGDSPNQSKTPKKVDTPEKYENDDIHQTPLQDITTSSAKNTPSNRRELRNSDKTPLKRKTNSLIHEVVEKSRKLEAPATVDNFFGFNDTANDQENIAPNRHIDKKRVTQLRARSTAVLQELNQQVGPCRGKVPAKTKFAPSSEIVNDLYEQMKSVTVPQVAEVNKDLSLMTVVSENDAELQESGNDTTEDEPAVLLFEDIETVHYNKPARKSYGKGKKVAFHQQTAPESARPASDVEHASGDSDRDLDDLTFNMPVIKTKKPKKKKIKVQKMSKKEEEEADAWAASFNSMCGDVDKFDLIIE